MCLRCHISSGVFVCVCVFICIGVPYNVRACELESNHTSLYVHHQQQHQQQQHRRTQTRQSFLPPQQLSQSLCPSPTLIAVLLCEWCALTGTEPRSHIMYYLYIQVLPLSPCVASSNYRMLGKLLCTLKTRNKLTSFELLSATITPKDT